MSEATNCPTGCKSLFRGIAHLNVFRLCSTNGWGARTTHILSDYPLTDPVACIYFDSGTTRFLSESISSAPMIVWMISGTESITYESRIQRNATLCEIQNRLSVEMKKSTFLVRCGESICIYCTQAQDMLLLMCDLANDLTTFVCDLRALRAAARRER